MILKDNIYVTVEKKDNVIIKTFKGTEGTSFLRDEKWFKTYDLFRKQHGHLPEIYDKTYNSLVMEYIEGTRLLTFMGNKNEFSNARSWFIISKYFDLISKFYLFSSVNNFSFSHTDLTASNIIMRDNEFIMIDINDLIIEEQFERGLDKIVHLSHQISKSLYKTSYLYRRARLKEKNEEYDKKIIECDDKLKEYDRKIKLYKDEIINCNGNQFWNV